MGNPPGAVTGRGRYSATPWRPGVSDTQLTHSRHSGTASPRFRCHVTRPVSLGRPRVPSDRLRHPPPRSALSLAGSNGPPRPILPHPAGLGLPLAAPLSLRSRRAIPRRCAAPPVPTRRNSTEILVPVRRRARMQQQKAPTLTGLARAVFLRPIQVDPRGIRAWPASNVPNLTRIGLPRHVGRPCRALAPRGALPPSASASSETNWRGSGLFAGECAL